MGCTQQGVEVRRPIKQGAVELTAGRSSQHDSHLAVPIEPSRVFAPPLLEDEDLSIQKLLLPPAVNWCAAIVRHQLLLAVCFHSGHPNTACIRWTEATGLYDLPSQLHSSTAHYCSTHRDSRIVHTSAQPASSQPHKRVACHNSRMFPWLHGSPPQLHAQRLLGCRACPSHFLPECPGGGCGQRPARL